MRVLLVSLFLSGCASVPAEIIEYKGIEWACHRNEHRMNCRNTKSKSRFQITYPEVR